MCPAFSASFNGPAGGDLAGRFPNPQVETIGGVRPMTDPMIAHGDQVIGALGADPHSVLGGGGNNPIANGSAAPLPTGSPALTFNFWVEGDRTSTPNNWGLIMWGTALGNAGDLNVMNIDDGTDFGIWFLVLGDAGLHGFVPWTANPFDGSRHMITVTFDGAHTVEAFVDGISQGTSSLTGGHALNLHNSGTLYIGCANNSGLSNGYPRTLDEQAAFTRVLSGDDIAALYALRDRFPDYRAKCIDLGPLFYLGFDASTPVDYMNVVEMTYDSSATPNSPALVTGTLVADGLPKRVAPGADTDVWCMVNGEPGWLTPAEVRTNMGL